MTRFTKLANLDLENIPSSFEPISFIKLANSNSVTTLDST